MNIFKIIILVNILTTSYVAQTIKCADDFFKVYNIELSAVEDTLEIDPYSFFPVQVGDFWQYSQQGGFVRNRWISKDSLLNDSSHLIYLNDNEKITPQWPDYRIDTSYIVYFDPNDWNRLYYKLNAKKGERWEVFSNYDQDSVFIEGDIAEVDTIYEGTYLGINSVFKVISTYLVYNNNGTIEEYWDHDKVLASGMGLVYESKDGVQPDILISAIINGDTLGTIVGVEKNNFTNYLNEFNIAQNYPNPFNSSTTLEYTVVKPGIYRIEIFNILGQKVKTHLSKYHNIGKFKTTIDFRGLGSGIYFGRISNNTSYKKIKMIYLK